MSKLRCNDCGWVFEEEDAYIYRERDVGYAAVWCPECHSDDLTEVAECRFCGELTPEIHLTIDGYCPDCVKRTAKKLDLFLNRCEPEELRIFEHEFGIEPISY